MIDNDSLETLEKLGVAVVEVFVPGGIQHLRGDDLVAFLPRRESSDEEGHTFLVERPAPTLLRYRPRNGGGENWAEASIVSLVRRGGVAILVFHYRDSGRGARTARFVEFGPCRAVRITRPSRVEANIAELQRAGILAG